MGEDGGARERSRLSGPLQAGLRRHESHLLRHGNTEEAPSGTLADAIVPVPATRGAARLVALMTGEGAEARRTG